jgi:hypothetical protein
MINIMNSKPFARTKLNIGVITCRHSGGFTLINHEGVKQRYRDEELVELIENNEDELYYSLECMWNSPLDGGDNIDELVTNTHHDHVDTIRDLMKILNEEQAEKPIDPRAHLLSIVSALSAVEFEALIEVMSDFAQQLVSDCTGKDDAKAYSHVVYHLDQASASIKKHASI